MSIVGEGRGPKFMEKCYRILLFLAHNGATKKAHIINQIEPAIDKPTVYKALAQLKEKGYITSKKIERWSDRGVKSEISRKGLLQLLEIYFRGPTASELRTHIFDLINKNPALRADPEWVATVQSLMPLIKKINAIISSRESVADIDEAEILPIVWQDPQVALGNLVRLAVAACLMETSNKQARVHREVLWELKTILQKHPMYLKLGIEVMKGEIERYDRMMHVKEAMEDFVATNSF